MFNDFTAKLKRTMGVHTKVKKKISIDLLRNTEIEVETNTRVYMLNYKFNILIFH